MAKKPNKHQKRLDVGMFVDDFVEGKLTLIQLADRHDRTPREIDDILAGRKHKRVRAGIEKAMAGRRDMTIRQLALLQDDAVAAMARAVRGQADTVSLSAAREILSRSLNASEPPALKAGRSESSRPAPPRPAKLGPDQKRRVLAQLDGPPPEA